MSQEQTLFLMEQIALWTGGKLLQGDPQAAVTSVAFDSRKLQPSGLFVALKAERDGHSFIPAAIERGAAGLLISDASACPADIPTIQVKDTLFALGELALHYVAAHPCQTIGITGSNGKTTCKEMVGQIMSRLGPICKTEGNFNNLIGLPMTLFGLSPDDKYAVLEMGMNAFGEIARLAEIAQPQVGLITTVAAAHLEGVGSIEGVARAKGELFAALSADQTAIINADNPHIMAQQKTLTCRRLFFTSQPHMKTSLPEHVPMVTLESCESLGIEGFALEVRRPVVGEDGVLISGGRYETFTCQLPLVGHHQVHNALASIATVTALGVPVDAIVDGLAGITPTGRRMRVAQAKGGTSLLDDCYNSNPNSARAALQTLRDLGKGCQRIAVLGDMLELGANAEVAHAALGRYALAMEVDALFAFGPLSAATAASAKSYGAQEQGLTEDKVFHFGNVDDIDALWEALSGFLGPETWVLVKGSRGMRLERISERIEAS